MNLLKAVFGLIFLSFIISACSPEREDYTEGWSGLWITNDDVSYPQNKAFHSGSIIKDDSENNRIIISGPLVSRNSDFKIPVKLTSKTAGTISYEQIYKITGTARFNSKDTIWLKINISKENKSENNEIILIKSK